MNKFHWSTIFYAVLLFSYCVQIAYATPPPPEGRSFYLLPNPAGPYYNQSIDLGFNVGSTYYGDGISSPFPRLSEYRGFRNFSFIKTGRTYISEVWYFNDWTAFKMNNDDLFHFLKTHGTLSPIVLNVTEELARTNDPWITGLHAKHINATQYIAHETSGYFIIFSTDFFPGENYYIAYYGVVGQSDLTDDTPQIKTLIMSCFPGFVEKQNHLFDPTSPVTRAVPLPVVIIILAVGCIGILAFGQRRRGK
jgi:hypothetical protein